MGLAYSFKVHFHHGRQHAGSHDAEDSQRVIHPLQAARRDCVSHWHSLSIYNLKAHLHSDTLPPTRPHLLVVPLPGPSIYKPPHPGERGEGEGEEGGIYLMISTLELKTSYGVRIGLSFCYTKGVSQRVSAQTGVSLIIAM